MLTRELGYSKKEGRMDKVFSWAGRAAPREMPKNSLLGEDKSHTIKCLLKYKASQ